MTPHFRSPPTTRNLALALLLGATSASAQPVAEEEAGTEMEVLVEARTPSGHWRSDIGAPDLAVEEDGIATTVISVLPLDPYRPSRDAVRRSRAARSPRPWRILIYFDTPLLTDSSRRILCEALIARTADLTALGTVEVVVAAPLPRSRLEATRDPKAVRAALEGVLHAPRRGTPIAALRRQHLDRGLISTFRDTRPGGWDLADLRQQVLEAARREAVLIDRQLETLRWWLSTYPPTLPKGLLYVSDGFDLSLVPFYLAGLADGGPRRQLASDLVALTLGAATEETGIQAAALGWTVLPLWRRSVRTTLSPGRDGQRPVLAREGSLMMTPSAALESLSMESGGEVSLPLDLERTLIDLNKRIIVTYRALRPPDGALHRVVVHAPELRLRIRGGEWRTEASGPKSAVATAFAGVGEGGGELDLSCELESGTAAADPLDLECRIRFGPRIQSAGAGPSTLFVTVFGTGPGGGRERVDRTFPIAGDPDQIGAGLELELPLPPRLRGRPLIVVVSEEQSGLWAVERLAAPLGLAQASEQWEAGARWLPDEKAVHLVPFDHPMVAGPVLVEAQTTRPEVAWVEFWLDRVRVATAEEPPFETWLKFGPLPEPHTIEAVAVAIDGRELGRDEMLVNQGLGRRRVRIQAPRAIAGPGPYDVELEVTAPPSVSPTRVELYWNQELLVGLERPPYRARVELPISVDGDYLRAAAAFDDGEVSEDALLKSRRGFTFKSEVELLELYTVAKDQLGRPVADLRSQDFSVFEEGRPQILSSFEYAEDVPLRLALTIDISESMHPRMPIVKHAAREFVEALLGPGDKAILAAFNHRPFLLQGPSTDAERLVHDIDQLPSTGGTALFDSIIFSLMQLSDLSGRKALVLLTDGKDKHSRFSLDAAVQFARRSSMPVYLIAIDAYRDPLDLQERLALGRLARLTGGEMFVIHSEERLADIYREIAVQLRHQYVLAYQSDYEGRSRSWRRVRIEVERPGVRAQTISGYFPNR